uniref:Uncharacterized protein n=1 Tax=Oryza rufipogon TaxID=4529 RepID=A0A0E0QZB6_ORYRU
MRGREPRLPLESIPPSHIASPGSACRCRRHTKTLIGSCNAMREKAHDYLVNSMEGHGDLLEQHGTIEVIVAVTR